MMRYALAVFYLLCFFACNDTTPKTTLPVLPEGTLRTFQFYGDSRENPDMYAALLAMGFKSYPSGPIIHLGDMISAPSHSEEYLPFKVLTTQFTKEKDFYVTVGNHDVDDAQSFININRVFPDVGLGGYYVKSIGNCFCIFLNSEDQSAGGNKFGPVQRAWLDEVLNSDAFKAAKFRMVMTHRPLFPQNQHKDEPFGDNDELHALFLQHKVDIVIAGHEHSYSHIVKDGLHYLVTGGGGSPLFEGGGPAAFFHYVQMFETDSELKFYAINFLGRTKDEFTVDLRRN